MTDKLELKFFKTHANVNIPKIQTELSACFDMEYNNAGKTTYGGFTSSNKHFTRTFTNATIHIGPKERVLVPTGLIFDIPEGYSVRIHPRSGLSLRNGIVLANLEAVIDADYVEEVYLMMTNTSDVPVTFSNGDRIAQAELVKVESYDIVESTVAPVKKTSRSGGLGSTGVKTKAKNPEKTTEKTLDKAEQV